MQTIIKLNCYSNSELTHINRCRLYLQVSSLSDITTACGKYLTHSATHCNFDSFMPHHYSWPNQMRPYQYSRRLWKEALKRAFPHNSNILTQKLGSWNNGGRCQLQWFHQPPTGRLYRCYRVRLRMYIRTS